MPFYFGPSERALYGVYDPPSGGASKRAAVICYPVGMEYYSAHRACRSLARQLAEAGVHALRFDYLGTGDSAKELDEVRAEDWLEDVSLAKDELRDMTGLRTVDLIGVRAGAALALAVALRSSDVGRLALWNPLPADREPTHSVPGVLSCERLLKDSIEAPPRDTLLLSSDTAAGQPALAKMLAAACPGFASARHEERGPWESDNGIGTVPIPVRSVETLVEWSKEGG